MKSDPFLFINSIITLFFLFFCFPTSYSEDDERYTNCSRPFSCGKLQKLSYPFWKENGRPAYCGIDERFKLRNCEHSDQFPIMSIGDEDYHVINLNQSGYVMTIARLDYWTDVCPKEYKNTTLDRRFHLTPTARDNISFFYNCDDDLDELTRPYRLSCGQQQFSFYASSVLLRELKIENPECSQKVDIPAPVDFLNQIKSWNAGLSGVLRKGFDVSYMYEFYQECMLCTGSGGMCGNNTNTSEFTCYCRDGVCPISKDHGPNYRVKIQIGVGVGVGTAILMLIAFLIYLRHKKKQIDAPSSYNSQSRSFESEFSSRSDVEKGANQFGIRLFTYEELEQATNNFDSEKELGEGGFGTVYYGKLKDGRTVAVKRLYENNYKRVEQFMNEVDILARLRHQNLVSLYGCTSRNSRELLLVYEFISNGTVADHLHGEKVKPGGLPWSTRIKIAVETASALTYLHASEIIHRDVKTNNILLDNNFVVKVADFGLSRLFPNLVTHISTAPQGTPGYVDPEYHECYQLTDKSDVYSFGVVLMELISSMPAVDITRHRHEINLSNMAINKIQSGTLHELVDRNLGYDADYAVRKMINAVAELAFQCLQSAKELRPSMEEVLQTLKAIQANDYAAEKSEEEARNSDVGLLKGGHLPPSPDTVMFQWNSSTTTPNTSG